MTSKGTQLRFLKGNNPGQLTELVGALPFKVEIKQIIKDKSSYVVFFTILEEHYKITNEQLRDMSGR